MANSTNILNLRSRCKVSVCLILFRDKIRLEAQVMYDNAKKKYPDIDRKTLDINSANVATKLMLSVILS